MTVRTVVLVLLSIFAAIFLILNWQGIMAPVPVNLLFETMEAPLGLILLLTLGTLWFVGILWALMTQAATLVEIRKAYREATANKTLAEKAEASRIEQVRVAIQEEMKSLESQILETVNKTVEAVNKTGETAQKNTSDAEIRLGALEKSLERFEMTLNKLTDKVGVAPVTEEDLKEPPKKGFFGFLSSSPAKEPAKPAPAPAVAEKTTLPATTKPQTPAVPAAEAEPAQTAQNAEAAPAGEAAPAKQGIFKKLFA